MNRALHRNPVRIRHPEDDGLLPGACDCVESPTAADPDGLRQEKEAPPVTSFECPNSAFPPPPSAVAAVAGGGNGSAAGGSDCELRRADKGRP